MKAKDRQGDDDEEEDESGDVENVER